MAESWHLVGKNKKYTRINLCYKFFLPLTYPVNRILSENIYFFGECLTPNLWKNEMDVIYFAHFAFGEIEFAVEQKFRYFQKNI